MLGSYLASPTIQTKISLPIPFHNPHATLSYATKSSQTLVPSTLYSTQELYISWHIFCLSSVTTQTNPLTPACPTLCSLSDSRRRSLEPKCFTVTTPSSVFTVNYQLAVEGPVKQSNRYFSEQHHLRSVRLTMCFRLFALLTAFRPSFLLCLLARCVS